MAVMEANRRLAVILSADIVGYSRLMALDEDGTVQTLATYQEVIAALVGEHAGRVKKGPVKRGTNLAAPRGCGRELGTVGCLRRQGLLRSSPWLST